jgi:quinol monooxygenase YgiN
MPVIEKPGRCGWNDSRRDVMKKPECTLVATLVAKPEKRSELLDILLGQVAPSRAEAGCLNYDLHCDKEDPNVFVFYENWVNREALDRHLEEPHLRPLMARRDELLAKPIDLRFVDMLTELAE